MHALSDRRMLLLQAGALMIVALMQPTEDLRPAMEKLREAAKLMGCADPRVSMKWLGGSQGVEIEVRCRGEGDDGR